MGRPAQTLQEDKDVTVPPLPPGLACFGECLPLFEDSRLP